jgi:4'-phosphopantetheinyl transferase
MTRPTIFSGWEPGPDEPPAPRDEAHLWLADIAASGLDSDAALRKVLGRYLGDDPASIRFATAPGGKPRLAERPERLRFNLSHSGDLVMVGVAAIEIGVDVQRVEPRRSHLAITERRLDAAAAEAVRNAPDGDRAEVFTAHWARFEARQKCLGLGVFEQAPEDADVTVASLDVGPGYAAAFALSPRRICARSVDKRAWALLG